MIRRDVQRRADVRAKRFGGFELKAGKLQHVPLSGARSLAPSTPAACRCCRPPAPAMPLGFQNVAGQRGGRRFSVRSGDADDFAFQEPAREFQIADDFHAARRAACKSARSAGTPGREHDQIGIRERGFGLRLDFETFDRDGLLIDGAHASLLARATTPPPPRRCAPSRPPRLLRLPVSSQFQRRQREQRQDQPGDPEARDDFRFLPIPIARSDDAAAPS